MSEKEEVSFLGTGDWHALDKYGINPSNTVSKEGTPISQSNLQKIVFRESQEICKRIGEIDVAIINGDSVEGKQVKAYGVPLMDADTDTQVDAAVRFYEATIHKYCKPKIVIMVMGTPYHILVGVGGNLDYQFAEKVSRVSNVIFGYPNLNILIGKYKTKWDIRHRMSLAKVNRMMPFEKTFRQYARLESESLLGDEKNIPDIIVRAHRHDPQIPFGIGEGRRWAMTTPPLKAVDVYADLLQYPVDCSVGWMTVIQKNRKIGSRNIPKFEGEFLPIKVETDEVEII